MPLIKMKRNDTRPQLILTLERNGVPVDLTGAVSAKFLMKVGNQPTISKTAAFATDRTSGKVQIGWSPTDTAQVGEYDVEVEVTWATGPPAAVETFPNEGYQKLKVDADLG